MIKKYLNETRIIEILEAVNALWAGDETKLTYGMIKDSRDIVEKAKFEKRRYEALALRHDAVFDRDDRVWGIVVGGCAIDYNTAEELCREQHLECKGKDRCFDEVHDCKSNNNEPTNFIEHEIES